jgi:hypothetical protein
MSLEATKCRYCAEPLPPYIPYKESPELLGTAAGVVLFVVAVTALWSMAFVFGSAVDLRVRPVLGAVALTMNWRTS